MRQHDDRDWLLAGVTRHRLSSDVTTPAQWSGLTAIRLSRRTPSCANTARSQGSGESCLSAAEAWCRSAGCDSHRTQCPAENEIVSAFWTTLASSPLSLTIGKNAGARIMSEQEHRLDLAAVRAGRRRAGGEAQADKSRSPASGCCPARSCDLRSRLPSRLPPSAHDQLDIQVMADELFETLHISDGDDEVTQCSHPPRRLRRPIRASATAAPPRRSAGRSRGDLMDANSLVAATRRAAG